MTPEGFPKISSPKVKCLTEFREQIKGKLTKLEKELPKDPEKCRICGAKMSIGRFEYGVTTFYCSKAEKTFIKTKVGDKNWTHFNDSRVELFTKPHVSSQITVLKWILTLLGELEKNVKSGFEVWQLTVDMTHSELPEHHNAGELNQKIKEIRKRLIWIPVPDIGETENND